MKRAAWALALLAAASGAALAAPAFTLTSPVLQAGAAMPRSAAYADCGGANLSPRLAWSDPPAGTRSYAVTLLDRDVTGGFWHWIAFDISIGAHGLNAGAGTPHSGNAPGDTVQLTNSYGTAGYGGPCPPAGQTHHYVFTVYALDVPKLGVAAHFSRADALAAIHKHALAQATLDATFTH